MNIEFDKKAGVNPLLPVKSLLQGVAMARHKKLRQYILIPIVINFCLYSGLLYLGYQYVGVLIAQFIPDWLLWLDWFIYPLFFICFFVIGFFSFTLVANLMAAPFYGGLAAKTLHLLHDEAGVIQEQPLLAVIGSEIKRMGYLLSRAIPIAIISVIPGLNLIAPILWGLFGAWGLSMEYFAYTLENEGFLFAEQREALRSVRIGALTFGGIVLLALMLPVLNMIIPPIAVVSAVIYRQRLAVK